MARVQRGVSSPAPCRSRSLAARGMHKNAGCCPSPRSSTVSPSPPTQDTRPLPNPGVSVGSRWVTWGDAGCSLSPGRTPLPCSPEQEARRGAAWRGAGRMCRWGVCLPAAAAPRMLGHLVPQCASPACSVPAPVRGRLLPPARARRCTRCLAARSCAVRCCAGLCSPPPRAGQSPSLAAGAPVRGTAPAIAPSLPLSGLVWGPKHRPRAAEKDRGP